MKALILSDLHHEFDLTPEHTIDFVLSLNNKVDLVFLPGDITTFQKMEMVMALYSNHFENSELIYVPGNHEFAGIELDELYTTFEFLMARCPNLNIFHDCFKRPVHKNIIAGTMWYKNAIECYLSCPDWFDFAFIPGNSPSFIKNENERFLKFLKENLNNESIVLTHMLPSWLCVHPKYAGSWSNKFFVCDVEELILERQPKVWCFGHTHFSFDFFIGNTRLVCNPKGHLINGKPENHKFNKELVIEV